MQVQRKNPWSHSAARPVRVVLLLALALMAGCAPAGKGKLQTPVAPLAAAATVTRLTEGRAGFVIRETATLNAEGRRTFAEAVTLLNQGEFKPAAELLEQVVAATPAVTAPYLDLALAYAAMEQPERAEASLKKALELVPRHPVASNQYGLLLRKSGRFAEARQVYEQALESFPEYLPLRRNLGILCDLYLNDPACALEQYQLYGQTLPADEQVQIWIADLRLRLGGS